MENKINQHILVPKYHNSNKGAIFNVPTAYDIINICACSDELSRKHGNIS